jgi:ribosomal-protein-alanine N-acetyltransferase
VSAVLRQERGLQAMTVGLLDRVLAIEVRAYAFPWTRGNFIDSLAAGYDAQVLHDAQGGLLGYFVAMPGLDEMHLLNITVAPEVQGQGHARFMLDAVVALCQRHAARQLWLEVRQRNARAQAIYLRYGFTEIGLRRGYYPAAQGQREDALVMGLPVSEACHGLD